MKVKMVTSMAGPGLVRAVGDEVEVEHDEGMRLIKAGFAIVLDERQTTVKSKRSEKR